MKLTKRTIEQLPVPDKGQTFFRDELLKGFGVRVSAKGTKSFFVEKRVNGRLRRETLGRFGELTAEQGRKEAVKYLGKIASGIDPQAERRTQSAQQVTLGEAFEAYLKTRTGLKPRTVADYRYIMQHDFGDWKNRTLLSISKDAVTRRHARLGKKSPARANNAMRVLRAVFNFAAGQYEDAAGRSLFPENPVKRLSHIRAWYRVERRRTYIRRSELPTWYSAVEHLRRETDDPQARTVGDFLLLVLFTGLRRGEALRLRWEDVDLTERTLTIPDTKNREPLVLPLSDFLHTLLATRRQFVFSPYVFPGMGEHGHLMEPRPQMRKVTEESGIPFTLHDLRRTFATFADSLEISPYALKRLVNHKTNDVTAGYISPDVEHLRPPMEKISTFLLRATGALESTVTPLNKAEEKAIDVALSSV